MPTKVDMHNKSPPLVPSLLCSHKIAQNYCPLWKCPVLVLPVTFPSYCLYLDLWAFPSYFLPHPAVRSESEGMAGWAFTSWPRSTHLTHHGISNGCKGVSALVSASPPPLHLLWPQCSQACFSHLCFPHTSQKPDSFWCFFYIYFPWGSTILAEGLSSALCWV